MSANTRNWLLVLVWGFGLWAASTLALVVTEDDILLPSVVLIGSFFVPVAVVFWFLERDAETELSPRRLLVAFFVAGVLGLLAAATLEVWFLPSRLLPNLWVGLIEEAVKAIGVIALARGLSRYTVNDGILLGVVVGLGFGAFESSGYTLSYGFGGDGFSLSSLISEELLRAVIAPFCHGLWTEIFGAALFGAARDGHLRITLGVVGVYFGAAALHALWDASSTAGDRRHGARPTATRSSATRSLRGHCRSRPRSTRNGCTASVQWAVMIVVAVVGVLLIRARWNGSTATRMRSS